MMFSCHTSTFSGGGVMVKQNAISLNLVLFLPLTFLYTICYHRRFDQVENGVHDRLHNYPMCGIFYFPSRIPHVQQTANVQH